MDFETLGDAWEVLGANAGLGPMMTGPMEVGPMGSAEGNGYMGHDEAGEDILGALADLLGEDALGEDVLGDDALGDDVLGAVRRVRRQLGRGQARRRTTPAARNALARALANRVQAGGNRLGRPAATAAPWRQTQVAPGVMAPFEAMFPLGFSGDGGNVMGPGVIQRVFRARPQKPFRGERFTCDIRRSAGAAGLACFTRTLFVGTDLNMGSLDPVSLDTFTPGSFDTRLVMTASQPGIEMTVVVELSAAVPAGESVTIFMQTIGRFIA